MQETGGHEDISTTQVYTNVTEDDIRKQMEKTPLAVIDSDMENQLIKELPLKIYEVDILG